MKAIRESSVELPALAAQRLAKYLGIQFSEQDAASDQACVTTLLDAVQDLARSQWAVRVIDVYALTAPAEIRVPSPSRLINGRWAVRGVDLGAVTIAEARMAAALEMFRALPDSVRAEIGERP